LNRLNIVAVLSSSKFVPPAQSLSAEAAAWLLAGDGVSPLVVQLTASGPSNEEFFFLKTSDINVGMGLGGSRRQSPYVSTRICSNETASESDNFGHSCPLYSNVNATGASQEAALSFLLLARVTDTLRPLSDATYGLMCRSSWLLNSGGFGGFPRLGRMP
jgi:hypothetical protein